MESGKFPYKSSGNFHHPAVRISNVEAEPAGVIEKQPEACFSRNCNKVMRTVKRGFVLRMVRVRAEQMGLPYAGGFQGGCRWLPRKPYPDIATLIDAAVCLPQPENHVLLRKRITETKALRKACFAKLRRTWRACLFFGGNIQKTERRRTVKSDGKAIVSWKIIYIKKRPQTGQRKSPQNLQIKFTISSGGTISPPHATLPFPKEAGTI